jgi:hypothetical protein
MYRKVRPLFCYSKLSKSDKFSSPKGSLNTLFSASRLKRNGVTNRSSMFSTSCCNLGLTGFVY